MILALSFLPAVVEARADFILFSYSGLYGTQLGVILAYSAGATPLGIWLMAGTFRQIPIRLEQAARIDGAGVLLTPAGSSCRSPCPGMLVVGDARLHRWLERVLAAA